MELNNSQSYRSILGVRPDISSLFQTPSSGTKIMRRKHFDEIENNKNYFVEEIPDDILYLVCFYFNRRDLINLMMTCKKFYQIGSHPSFWEFLNLHKKRIIQTALHDLLNRHLRVLRLNVAVIEEFPFYRFDMSKNLTTAYLTHLDLSETTYSNPEILLNLLCRCRKLQALSLELCGSINNKICHEIAQNFELHFLNFAMAVGINTLGLTNILKNCLKIEELNIGWINPTDELIQNVIPLLPASIKRLNFSGTKEKEKMNDENVKILCERCPNLLELDLSDNLVITEAFFPHLPNQLKVLVLSRCYAIEPMAFLSLTYLQALNIYGCVTDEGVEVITSRLHPILINRNPFTTIARPTVYESVTSIWNERTRDWY